MESVRSIPIRSRGPVTDYEVRVGPGAVDELPQLTRERAPAHRYAVVSDETVAGLYGAAVAERFRSEGMDASLLTFPTGEENKARKEWSRLIDAMLAAGFGRDTAVVAVGGGVTGDLAGFVAAAYMRGVPVVQVPTTLLAMVDASVGGKTGVDAPAGKNVVGAFHPPRLVLADPTLLQTLPTAEVRNGLAEVVKHGAIADAGYFRSLEERGSDLTDVFGGGIGPVVARSVEIKAAVVERDEREGGLRRILNFGHTVGHALEAATGYRIPHGEAVSIGMVAEAALGEAGGVTEAGTARRLEALLREIGLPTRIPGDVPARELVVAARSDKKRRRGRVTYVLPETIGTAADGDGWSRPLPDELVLRVLESRRGDGAAVA